MTHFHDAMRSLAPFFEDQSLSKILTKLSSGKEATVYCCEAGPALGQGRLVAAKIFRTPERRAFGGHKQYTKGRYVRGRTARKAIDAGNTYGQNLLFEKWVAYEYQVLGRLFRAGITVPEPLGFGGFSMLMDYQGDAEAPAPHLRNVILPAHKLERILQHILFQVEDMLAINLIHGDLSPYNILFWKGRPVIIDVPQALDPRTHPEAREILTRDILRITEWARAGGVQVDGLQVAEDMWRKWWNGDL